MNVVLYRKRGTLKAILLTAVPLLLSAFTHLWNPVGFPGVHYDEAIYIERGIRLLEGLGPQDPSWRYDHPFFTQILLGGVFSITGYPHSLQPGVGDAQSVEKLYSVPRVLMGLLAIFDTFLIYKISETRYNRNVALIASILFAVMPLNWVERRVYLESIQLPLILSAILFSMYCRGNIESNKTSLRNGRINLISIALSGLFLGLAIFTKFPAVSMIPLVAFLVYSNGKKDLKALGVWFIPVILIPMIWPIHAASVGELDIWLDTERGVLWQTQRVGQPLYESINSLFEMDPILITLGTVGILYMIAVRRDPFPALWIFPLLAFLYIIQFSSFWHLVPLSPMYSIASAILVFDISKKIAKRDRLQTNILEFYDNTDNMRKKLKQFGDFYLLYQNINHTFDRLRLMGRSANHVAFVLTAGISLFGLISTILLIQTGINSAHYGSVAYLVQYLSELRDNYEAKHEGNITVVGSPRYFWIPKYVFDEENYYKAYKSTKPVQTDTSVVIADRGFMNTLQESELMQSIYHNTTKLATFNGSRATYDTKVYPYVNIKYASPYGEIEIRTNHNPNDS